MTFLPQAIAEVQLEGMTVAPGVATFELDNGLEVVVIPDHRAPVVTHMIWYKAGAADEPRGVSGIAHYLEHLMFKGTEAHPGSTFSDQVAALGGRENAFTSNDYTGYYQQVAKQHLGEMMTLEADRMRNLVLTPEVVAPELNVVLEERRSRIENDPSAELGESLDATLFVNHGYGDPVIGWPDEVAALDADDALRFYHRFYVPQNAVLVIAGDITPDEVRDLAEASYGQVPRGAEFAPRTRTNVPDIKGRRLIELVDARASQPSTQRGWVVPSYTTAPGNDAEALDVLAQILGGGSTSRLYRDLVRGDGAAASAGAWYQSSALNDTRFMAWALPKEGTDLAGLEDGITRAIETIATDGVTDGELRRAKTSLVSSALFAQDSQSSLARIFGTAVTTGSSVEDVQNWPAAIAAVTAADVQRVARTYLDPQRSVTGRLLTGPAEKS